MAQAVVAHVNYLFFHSTQSYIYFYLSRFRRTRPLVLTRTPESPGIDPTIAPALAGNFYQYGQAIAGHPLKRHVYGMGIIVRRLLARMPPRLSDPLLQALHRRIVPRLRPEADGARYLAWAGDILTRRQAQLIHAYYGPVGWRMLALKRRLGVPLVVSFLGDDVAPRVAAWWSWWIAEGAETPDWPARLSELLTGGDLFLTEGPVLRQRLVDLGAPPERVVLQRIAIPVAEMPFRARARRTGDRAVILFAGRFAEQKGLVYALDAVRALRQDRRDFEFRIVGDETLTDGTYASRIYAEVRRHRLSDCVRMLGFLNRREYIREMDRADVFLHPSVTALDGASEGGAPTTILEAQALGMPVVSTYHCDIPNVTAPDRSALLVRERDSGDLARALGWLLDHGERWADMGRAGRAHVERYHDVDREAPGLETRYLSLLDESPG
ncbi:MAG TPA: glycosyltransferase [Candidatus Methylomirabilis sp.]|nr:glycosyltransferase [Candidatus Methylomirabilis sp.]